MTAGAVFGFLLFVIVIALQIAAGEKHREETGVSAPSRKAMARMRRNARRKGISNDAAYDQWLHNKQVQAGVLPTQRELAALQVAYPTAALNPPVDSAGTGADSVARVSRVLPTIDNEPPALKECRRHYGVNLLRLSAATGLSRNMLGQIENGTRTVTDDVTDKLKTAIRALYDNEPEDLTEYRIVLPRARKKRTPKQSSETPPPTIDAATTAEASLGNLEVTVRDWTSQPANPDAFSFNFDLRCIPCGGKDIEVPEDEPSDHSPASCKACGERFGSWGEVRSKATGVAHAYMHEHRIGAYGRVELDLGGVLQP